MTVLAGIVVVAALLVAAGLSSAHLQHGMSGDDLDAIRIGAGDRTDLTEPDTNTTDSRACATDSGRGSWGSRGGWRARAGQPCLRCRCRRGALECQRRACRALPRPPPPRCVLVLRRGRCCEEVLCEDTGGSSNHLSRAEPAGGDLPTDRTSFGEGCIDNGTLYGSGSAMATSGLCDYCYCIGGAQRCVQPRCLLPAPGCEPRFSPMSCCPVRYDCSRAVISSSTTTASPSPSNGCTVDGVLFPEGEKVTGVTRSPCDNCFCMRGSVRCVPLSCAPALLGCTPVVLPGKCCASSYNCTKELKTIRPNDGNFLTSKSTRIHTEPEVIINERSFPDDTPLTPSQIAELLLNSEARIIRKIDSKQNITIDDDKVAVNISTTTITNNETVTEEDTLLNTTQTVLTTKASIETTTLLNNLTASIESEILKFDDSLDLNSDMNSSVTNIDMHKISSTNENKTDVEISSTKPNIDKMVISNSTLVLNSTIDDKLDKKTILNDTVNCTTEISTLETNSSNVDVQNNTSDEQTVIYNDTQERIPFISDLIESALLELESSSENISSSADPNDNVNEENDISSVSNKYPSTSLIIPKDDDIFMVNVSTFVRTNSSVVTLRPVAVIPPEIEALLNMSIKKNTQKDDYYDYDYKSSLPPSLPNLEIIPFLAIDAVLKADEVEREKVKELDHYATAYPALDQEKNFLGSFPTNPREKFNTTSYSYMTSDTFNPTTFPSFSDDKYNVNPTSFPPARPNNFNRNPSIYKQHINDKFQATTYKTIVNDKYDPGQYAQDKYDATIYPSLTMDDSQTENPAFAYDSQNLNLFSPPVETEGGFLPRDPPLANSYYEMGYPTSDEANSATESSMMVTDHAKTNTDDCVSNGREYKNGELITEPNACVVCFCYYGDIHCQDPECPAIKLGCRRIIEKGVNSCCGVEICNENTEKNELPKVTVENENKTPKPLELVTNVDRIDTPDPFRDVIRTEAAPNLQSLMGDMMPYYVRKPTTTTTSTSTQEPTISKIPTFVVPSKVVKYSTTTPATTIELPTSTTMKSEKSNIVSIESKPLQSISTTEAYYQPSEIYTERSSTTSAPFEIPSEESEPIEEDEEEEFSFDSVLKLFLGDSSDTTTARTIKKYISSTTPSTTTQSPSTTTTTTVSSTTTERTTTRPTMTYAATTTQPSTTTNIYKNTYKYSFTKPNRTLSSISLLHKNFTKPIKSTTKAPSAYPTVNRPNKLKYPYTTTTVPSTTITFKKLPGPIISPVEPPMPSFSRKPIPVPLESALPFGAGLLKLAGCNIYGRMYRVGRIISELSGPCLECMCTEVGVQCRPLSC